MAAEAGSRSALEARAGRLTEYAQKSLEEFDVEAFKEDLEERIRRRPIVSVLIAVAAGFFIGRLIRS